MRIRVLLAVLLCLVGPVGAAWGQTSASVNCAANPTCLSLFEQAQQQSNAGQLDVALRTYKRAYKVQADPRLLFSIARVLHKLGQSADAVTYYQRFINSDVDDAEHKGKALEYKTQLESRPAVPVYKKGWFWGVIAGSAAVVGLSLGLGLGLGLRSGVNTYEPHFPM